MDESLSVDHLCVLSESKKKTKGIYDTEIFSIDVFGLLSDNVYIA